MRERRVRGAYAEAVARESIRDQGERIVNRGD